ncbi:alpha-N-acetylgalactosamine-specific lectin-like [Pollicipes pollicipes]|uniref:alpha-N-acetylgalactosamine-specific lectin-like n=1 Tax=Pollicipes pollicipes TaxID=41117 RepID=UPI0018849EC7|nr:alpha-N-acetylgalactosamine-specific lectin-like [Pollicipes pollicipes]
MQGQYVTTALTQSSCGPELRAVCEAPQSARLPRGCPPTWLEIDTYCYLAVSQALTFHQADQHCGQLAGGARLGHPHGPGVHTILEAYASQVGISGNFWVGVRDEASEGTWQSMDGSAWHFAWSPVHYQPNGGTTWSFRSIVASSREQLDSSLSQKKAATGCLSQLLGLAVHLRKTPKRHGSEQPL